MIANPEGSLFFPISRHALSTYFVPGSMEADMDLGLYGLFYRQTYINCVYGEEEHCRKYQVAFTHVIVMPCVWDSFPRPLTFGSWDYYHAFGAQWSHDLLCTWADCTSGLGGLT